MPTAFHLNPAARGHTAPQFFTRAELADVARFYETGALGPPSPLRSLPGFARKRGIRGLLVKDESSRYGANAFKILGVQFAVHRLLERHAGGSSLELACVTAGNHGRAVARVAKDRGLRAHVVVPAGTVRSRIDAIAGEGAEVIVSRAGYDEAVAELAREADQRGWTVVSDTSWPGYEAVPRDIMTGYTWLFEEARRSWAAPPEIVLVQAGVGGLAASALGWLHATYGQHRPFTIVCEPLGAACLLASARAGRRVSLTGPLPTHMAGLRCGEPSPLAWEVVRPLADAFVAIPDDIAERAVRELADPDEGDPAIVAGSSGACGVGALLALAEDPALAPVRQASGFGTTSSVFAIVTEGVTDPELHARIMNRKR